MLPGTPIPTLFFILISPSPSIDRIGLIVLSTEGPQKDTSVSNPTGINPLLVPHLELGRKLRTFPFLVSHAGFHKH